MKKNKWKAKIMTLVEILIIYLLFLSILFVGIKTANDLNSQKSYNQMIEAFETVDRYMAIEQLSELRGMILEVKSLVYEGVSQDILMDQLEDIISQDDFSNPYIRDFTLSIPPDTSYVGAICERLIMQIDDQIHIIEVEFDEKGE